MGLVILDFRLTILDLIENPKSNGGRLLASEQAPLPRRVGGFI
jgi:hypothetical protein